MYTMKDVCKELNISYDTLKFYCNEGLIPNVKRNENNHRVFNELDINWIKGLQCLRKCGMSIKDMKQYMEYCLIGEASIPERKEMLEVTRKHLEEKHQEIIDSLEYIDNKQKFYDDVLSGKIPYYSNIIKTDES
ncbi:MAG: MerR family transcriptional regulator [Erysipelotrichales bacterium]|nr:MerR family transcriptional regulator [Erysipelotrichales bacterium]